jgi:hypothetical protein
VEVLPVEDGRVYGVGAGGDVETAYTKAARVLAAQLQVQITGRSTSSQTMHASSKDGGNEKVSYSESVDTTATLVVNNSLEDVRIADQWRAADGKQWVLATLDLKALAAKEDAIVGSVLESLAQVQERLGQALAGATPLSYEAYEDALASMASVSGLGRTDMGRKLKERWRNEFERAGRVMGKLSTCLEVTDERTGEGELAFKVTCNKRPWSRARLAVKFVNAVGELPATVESSDDGEVKISTANAFGKEGSAGVMLQLDAGRHAGAVWLTVPPRWSGRMVPLKGLRAGRVTVELADDNSPSLRPDIDAALSTSFGLQSVADGELVARTQILRTPVIQTGSMWVTTQTLTLQVVADGVVLANQTWKGSGVGSSARGAELNADQQLRQALRAVKK